MTRTPGARVAANQLQLTTNHFSLKVTIIGGGGRVGSCAAFALQCAGLVAQIQVLDANKDMAEGEALDLLHGSAFAGDQKIYSGDYARAAQELSVSQDVVKASVKRWMSRYSELFLAEFRQVVANAPDDIQGEVREMLEALYRAVELGEIQP